VTTLHYSLKPGYSGLIQKPFAFHEGLLNPEHNQADHTKKTSLYTRENPPMQGNS